MRSVIPAATSDETCAYIDDDTTMTCAISDDYCTHDGVMMAYRPRGEARSEACERI